MGLGILDGVEKGAKTAKTPVGRLGNPIKILSKNTPTIINGRKFTEHALDQMQARGIISPSAVLGTIENYQKKIPGNTPGTMIFIRDNIKVVINEVGDIVTVIPQ
jgi:hypothetical protein